MKKTARRLGKRNLVIIAVLLFVCAAVYLNWSYNNKWGDADSAMAERDETEALSPAEEAGEAAEAGPSDYFAEARLSRQVSRDEALSLLETAVAAETATQEVIDAAMGEITAMATWSMLETQIENLVLAKGYAECVAYLSDQGVTIAVPAPAEGLTEADVARVTETVTSETDYTVEQIMVIEVKN